MNTTVARHRTALWRRSLSRPLALALDAGLLTPERSVLDYGCGRGTDVARLSSEGYDCVGWDPAFFPASERRLSDIVNLGYVVNVIERVAERAEALLRAWALARVALVVSARLVNEEKPLGGCAYADGILTTAGTFQKFFQQDELRGWLEATLGVSASAAGPGVFFIFRDAALRGTFLASRYRQRLTTPPVEACLALYESNRELLDEFMAVVVSRGRLPAPDEFPSTEALQFAFGTCGRAFGIVRRITNPVLWERIRRARSRDLLVYLALSRFRGRLRFSELPVSTQRDVRSFLGSYTRASALADSLLLRVGKPGVIESTCGESELGKLTGSALYVHVSCLERLHPILRVYEGCAAALIGHVEDTTIVKFARREPRISYLAYPDFDRDPHPPLVSAWVVRLRELRMDLYEYQTRENPPILHRKDALVATDYPYFQRFAHLTAQEERAGLLDGPTAIGTRDGWGAVLESRGYSVVGHRLTRRPADAAG